MAINDIPKKAYIDAQILLDIRMTAPRALISNDIERSYGVPQGSFGGGNFIEVRVLSLLYLLIAYPKEFWTLKPDDVRLRDVSSVFSFEGMDISWGDRRFPDHDHYEFIHRIRNAVAHANIEFRDKNISLKDRNGFEARLDLNEMSRFLTSVGSFLANMTQPSMH